jgi:hypothetical protein
VIFVAQADLIFEHIAKINLIYKFKKITISPLQPRRTRARLLLTIPEPAEECDRSRHTRRLRGGVWGLGNPCSGLSRFSERVAK